MNLWCLVLGGPKEEIDYLKRDILHVNVLAMFERRGRRPHRRWQ